MTGAKHRSDAVRPLRLGQWASDPARACAQPGVDPEVFFPEHGNALRVTRAALNICRRCPVKADCLADALRNPWLRGIWGGMTEGERDRMTRRRDVAP